MARRNLAEQRVEAERIIFATEQAMQVDAVLLEDPAERAAIEAAVADLRQAAAGDEHRAIAARIEDLETLYGAASRNVLVSVSRDILSAGPRDIDARLSKYATDVCESMGS